LIVEELAAEARPVFIGYEQLEVSS